MLSVQIKAIEKNDFDIWLPLWKDYQPERFSGLLRHIKQPRVYLIVLSIL